MAYFAKGPLSRARACINHEGSGDLSQLITFLRSMILSVAVLDKKYSEAVPAVVHSLPFHLAADEQDLPTRPPKRQSHKSKKAKIGKDGFYPDEQIHVTRWWMSKDVTGMTCDTDEAREHCTHDILLEQRAREVQLQIILILETLALDMTTKANGLVEATETQPATLEKDPDKPKKKKKPQNLELLLDLLVDRLGIWQSMALEDVNPTKDATRTSFEATHQRGKQEVRSNQLRQFCVDVVIPL